MRSVILAVVVVAAWVHAPAAMAQATGAQPSVEGQDPARDQEARSLFEAGVSAYDNGRYRDALDHFTRAHELSGRPKMLYNIAQAADRLRMDASALAALRAYREQVPDADNRAQVDNRIRALEAKTGGDAAQEPPPAAATPAPAPQPQPQPVGPAPGPTALDASLQADATESDGGSVLTTWWFWTATGALLTGVVIGVALASSGGDETASPTTGTDGMVVVTLGAP